MPHFVDTKNTIVTQRPGIRLSLERIFRTAIL